MIIPVRRATFPLFRLLSIVSARLSFRTTKRSLSASALCFGRLFQSVVPPSVPQFSQSLPKKAALKKSSFFVIAFLRRFTRLSSALVAATVPTIQLSSVALRKSSICVHRRLLIAGALAHRGITRLIILPPSGWLFSKVGFTPVTAPRINKRGPLCYLRCGSYSGARWLPVPRPAPCALYPRARPALLGKKKVKNLFLPPVLGGLFSLLSLHPPANPRFFPDLNPTLNRGFAVR